MKTFNEIRDELAKASWKDVHWGLCYQSLPGTKLYGLAAHIEFWEAMRQHDQQPKQP